MKHFILILSLLTAATLLAQLHAKSPSPFLQSLTESYLGLQSSLANDDLTAANEAALFYIAAFSKSTASLNIENLTQHANAIASAPDLSTARVAFKQLSEQARMLFEYLSTNSPTPLYIVRCSMAFEGQGAEWIQSTTQIANPYYGAQMLRCGSITRTIGTPRASASSEAPSMSCCSTNESSGCSHETSGSSCCKK